MWEPTHDVNGRMISEPASTVTKGTCPGDKRIRYWRSRDVTEPGDQLPIDVRNYTTRQDKQHIGPKPAR
mgnify:CR=1 FL=1